MAFILGNERIGTPSYNPTSIATGVAGLLANAQRSTENIFKRPNKVLDDNVLMRKDNNTAEAIQYLEAGGSVEDINPDNVNVSVLNNYINSSKSSTETSRHNQFIEQQKVLANQRQIDNANIAEYESDEVAKVSLMLRGMSPEEIDAYVTNNPNAITFKAIQALPSNNNNKDELTSLKTAIEKSKLAKIQNELNKQEDMKQVAELSAEYKLMSPENKVAFRENMPARIVDAVLFSVGENVKPNTTGVRLFDKLTAEGKLASKEDINVIKDVKALTNSNNDSDKETGIGLAKQLVPTEDMELPTIEEFIKQVENEVSDKEDMATTIINSIPGLNYTYRKLFTSPEMHLKMLKDEIKKLKSTDPRYKRIKRLILIGEELNKGNVEPSIDYINSQLDKHKIGASKILKGK